ncbi:hypothetical protein ABW20_dc0107810 [Dactylellina cionopaga]|nr:hypothetical protein ABW20_dc0107810 [Dactylellina cionopaga]
MAREERSPHKFRKGIKGAFPEADIVSGMCGLNMQKDEKSMSASSQTNPKASILRAWTKNHGNRPQWPKWSTLTRNPNETAIPLKFTIRIQPSVIDYSRASSKEGTAVEVFTNAASHINDIREIIKRSSSADDLEKAIIDQIAMVVFGSNYIECAGLGLDETIQLCRIIFSGITPSNILARSPEYQERLEELAQSPGQSFQKTKIRDRREVINHAGAFMYMIDRVINQDEFFSEDLICSTHKILVRGVDAKHENRTDTPSEQYAGLYRRVHVSAGNTNFVTPNFISTAMKRFIKNLNESLRNAEAEKELDPFYIAADACGEFVNIHPFLDGNGRICRLILNTILLKYAGIVAPIGEHAHERGEYLEIAKRRGEDECGNGELAFYTLRKGSETLKKLRDKLFSRI